MSSTLPSRRCGIIDSIVARYSGPSSSSPSVTMLPGITAFMVMPRVASSIAAVRRKPSLAAFVGAAGGAQEADLGRLRGAVVRPAGIARDRAGDGRGEHDATMAARLERVERGLDR